MDLSTRYLGMTLRSPLVPSSSPLCEDIDKIRQMEDAGAGAVVLHSLFEEQLTLERSELFDPLDTEGAGYAESLAYFPESDEIIQGPDAYYEHIRNAKGAVDIPIIASVNGSTMWGWTDYARKIEEAGADALELNIYTVPSDPSLTAEQVEDRFVQILTAVKETVNLPVAMKLSPFFSSPANMAQKLVEAGADGLVLFNRFYQPDIFLQSMSVRPRILLSTPQSMRLPLRWIAILRGRIEADLAATSGIHRAGDALKLIIAGADVTMLCSVLLRHGIGQIRVILQQMGNWIQAHGHENLKELRGRLSQEKCADPEAFERAQYIKALKTFKKR